MNENDFFIGQLWKNKFENIVKVVSINNNMIDVENAYGKIRSKTKEQLLTLYKRIITQVEDNININAIEQKDAIENKKRENTHIYKSRKKNVKKKE